MSLQELFEEVDKGRSQGSQTPSEVYGKLKKAYDSDPDMQENTDLLWRLARACLDFALTLNDKDAKKKDLFYEGRAYALKAYEKNDEEFNIVKWVAALTGQCTNFMGTKEKIEQGKLFKSYLDKAISLDPKDGAVLHMRGRYAYSVASLSWIERKIASTLFATPPAATYEEALADFLEAEKFKPEGWLENRVFVARCYLALDNKEKIVEYLKLVKGMTPLDATEKELHVENDKLLKKYGN